MNNTIKMVKSLQDSSVLIDGVTETVKYETKIRRGRISLSFLSTFCCFISIASDFFSSERYD